MPTIKELAEACSLSPLTVSRAMRGDKIVSFKTRQRVRDVAEQIGYTTNILARQLKVGRTHMVGVMLNDYSSEFVGRLVQGAQHECARADFDIVTLEWSALQDDCRPFIERICGRQFEGLIMCQWGHDHEVEFFREVLRRSIPVVAVDREADVPGIPFVGIEDRAGAKQAVEYLIAQGHRQIGHIMGNPEHSCSKERLMGFYDAMSDHDLTVSGRWVVEGDFRYDGALQACRKFFENPDYPTAVFAGSDVIAAVFIQVAAQRGLRCPDDISVMGFSDEAFARFMTPALTTVSSDPVAMGEQGARTLCEMIEAARSGKKMPPCRKRNLLPVEIIERQSVRNLNH